MLDYPFPITDLDSYAPGGYRQGGGTLRVYLHRYPR